MSRTATAAAQSALTAQAGKDAFVVLKLTLGTHVYWFSDRDVTQGGLNLDGRVQSHGTLNTAVKVGRDSRIVGTVSSMDFSLLDQDKALLALLDANDFQGATAQVYHWFVGHDAADMLLILNGRLETAPKWVEDDRTLKVTVETPRRINPIPFAPTEADALDVDEALLGHAWPMCFGTPSDVPAVQVKAAPRGTLIQDMTQDGQMEDVDGVATDVPTTVFEIENSNEDFPQDEECLIKVADEYMTGSFSGNTLTVTKRQVNHYTGVEISGTGEIITVPAGVRAAGQYIMVRDHLSTVESRPVDEVIAASALSIYSDVIGVPDPLVSQFVGYCYKQVGTSCYIWNGNPNLVIQNSVADINRYPNPASAGAKWVHKAGSPVVVASVTPVWIANSIPSDSIVRVRAWRQVTKDDHSGYSTRQLVTVPESFYTADVSDSAYLEATTITLQEDLGDRESGWDSQLFVTVESSVGSNTADAIKYLIDHQSEGKLSSDAVSFAAVRTLLVKYPSNFAIREQGDVLDICGDIAWQARCGLVWNGASAQIKYLSKEPTAGQMDLTDDNVAEGSLNLGNTRIEDVITVFNAEWQPNYSDVKPKKLLYRTNVARYGKREQRYTFWIYQQRPCVKKSADFWSRRLGRIWRTVDAANWGLEGLVVDALDYAGWRVNEFYASVYGLVTSASMDHPSTGVEVLLPIETGTLTQSSYFWISDSGDVAPAERVYGGAGLAEAEIIQAPPPEVISLSEPDQQVFNVVANLDEIRDPASSEWKTVEVRIRSSDEVQATADYNSNQEQIDTIDSLDPDAENSSLQSQRAELAQANADLTAYIQGFIDHPEIVVARNPSSLYMKLGDEGTMIKVPGDSYVVTPANASGPFIVRVSKRPESPAEGKLYVDFQGTVGHPTARETQQINVLGDTEGIAVGDLMLVFRDSLGNYFTPGNSQSGQHGIARVVANSGDATAIPVEIWLTTDMNRDPDITTTAAMPSLLEPYQVAAGAIASAQRGIDGNWWLQMVTIQNYVVS